MSSRRDLPLQQKVELIKDNNYGNGLTQRKLAEKYNISLGSVSNVLKRKAEYLNDYETNQNQNVKRKVMNVNAQKLDEDVYEWLMQQRSKNIPISGPILQEKAREIDALLGDKLGSFKGSNGWLNRFRTKHNISFRAISGESVSVNITPVDDWIQRIPKIIDGYDSKDIFNCNEKGPFYRLMPDKSLTLNKEECKGGKKSKERYSVLFCVNSTGDEKLKPFVIAKSLKLRCFKHLNVNKLPVDWRANKTAWMNVKLLSEWLSNLNILMEKQKTKIILFLDNAPCHPVDIELSNIKLQYFPPNTTSKLQPLDQGIIHVFKIHYRKYLVKHIIARSATAQTSNDIKVTALDVIAGFKDKQHDDITTAITIDLLASSADSTEPIDDEPSKYLEKLDDLLQHVTIDGQTMNAHVILKKQDDDDDDDDRIPTESPPKIMEAMEILRKLHLPATIQEPQLHQLISQLESKLTDVYIHSKAKKQTKLEDFFKHH
ncbi:unnamed protein product [Rotaria magnacalcarata]|uniref:HTH CENPB-type domain-containing protein n=1 Tax=Rotaria magnacalcarata TaxID=392030 RepID=A0A816XWB7_9BILA|nr:unnamed protein product [Rotaria magnacalcarata]CAF2151530.1 unnamed protein product [Rotaria magnacalcarata]CAF3782491.1 unnamed protein product [Rotaria magnacalcarata]CAF3827958.1 unnamed protein product [Rotaria magnacalcarata]